MTDTTVHTPEGAQPPLQAASTPASRPINSSHVVATGGVTAMLASVFMWISHWPLQPLDADTSLSLAGLSLAAGGGVIAFLKSRKGAKTSV